MGLVRVVVVAMGIVTMVVVIVIIVAMMVVMIMIMVMVMVMVMVIVAAIGAMDVPLAADAHVVAMPMMYVAVMRAIMRAMVVIMAMHGRRRDIGAAFRIERRLDRSDLRAEPARHILDHMIAPDAQALAEELGLQMAIAEMPGEAHERGRIGAADFGELFGRRDHFDDAAVVQFEPIARAQHHRLWKVEQKGEAAHACHGDPAPIALVIVEDDRIGGLARPGAGGTDGMSMLHF
jgi:hypothetical protein